MRSSGSLWRFRCPAGGYEATVPGGDDAGMIALTITILCSGCRELLMSSWGVPRRAGRKRGLLPPSVPCGWRHVPEHRAK